MRKIIVLAAAVAAAFGCSSAVSSEDEAYSQVEAAVAEAQGSGEVEEDIFLGFKFGMSEEQFMHHLGSLIDSGKVHTSGSGHYQYDLNHKTGLTLHLNFIPKYHGGKLYEVTFPITNAQLGQLKGSYVFMVSAFRDSDRGKNFKMFISQNDEGDEIYTFIKNNLIVTFKYEGGPVMEYSNAPTAKAARAEEEETKKQKAKASYSEF